MSRTQLWFDLEGTVIPTWDHMDFWGNIPEVNRLKENYKPDVIGIYSYAVHDNSDIKRLQESDLFTWLKAPHNSAKVLTTVEMARHWANYRYFGNPVTLTTSDVWKLPKEYSFIMSMTGLFGEDYNGTFILYDDTVGRINKMKVGDNTFIFIKADSQW